MSDERITDDDIRDAEDFVDIMYLSGVADAEDGADGETLYDDETFLLAALGDLDDLKQRKARQDAEDAANERAAEDEARRREAQQETSRAENIYAGSPVGIPSGDNARAEIKVFLILLLIGFLIFKFYPGCQVKEPANQFEVDSSHKISEAMEPIEQSSGVADRSWSDLRNLSNQLGTVQTEEQRDNLLKHYGITDENGNFTSVSFAVADDGSIPSVRIVDTPKVGGRYSLTFMFTEPVAWRQIEDGATEDWPRSSLRSWLNGPFLESLPEEVSGNIAPTEVVSYSNGQEFRDREQIWIPSITQIEGLLPDDYFASAVPANTVANYNAEGVQLGWFAQQGVTPYSDITGLAISKDGSLANSAMWTRSQLPPGTANDGQLHFLVIDETDRSTPGPVVFSQASDSSQAYAVMPCFTLYNSI